MKTLTRCFSILITLSVISCVTINIYFPAEELRGAADKIVEEVWGDRNPQDTEKNPPQQPGSSIFHYLQPTAAYAAQDINVSTPEIRAIKASIKKRSAALAGFLKSGTIGIGQNGLLKVRSTAGLNLKQRGQVNKLVKAENKDRLQLYKEIAVANGFPDKTAEVQNIFADSWRKQAAKGWFLEKPNGTWAAK